MSRALKLNRFRLPLIAGAVLLGVWLGMTGRHRCLLPGAESRLLCAVNANVGYGHLTRGMNMHTIEALDKAAGEGDLQTLAELLKHDDRITAMTAAEVLAKRGAKGRQLLLAAFNDAKKAKDSGRSALVNEHGHLNQKLY